MSMIRLNMVTAAIGALALGAALVSVPADADTLLQKTGRVLHHTARVITNAARTVAHDIKITFGAGSYGVKPKAGVGVGVSLAEAAPGTELTITAVGLPANADAIVSAGATADTAAKLADATADAHGKLSAKVDVPTEAKAGDTLVFVVATTDKKVRLVSGKFTVIAPPLPTPSTGGAGNGGVSAAAMTVTGVLAKNGAECPVLTGDDGKTYSLTPAEAVTFATGDHVQVVGTKADMSTCMQGTTIKVTSISAAK